MSQEPLKVAFALGIGDTAWAVTKLRALSAHHGGRPIEAHVNCSPNHATVGYLEICPQVAKAVFSKDAPYDVWNEMPPNHRFPKWSTLKGCAGWRGYDYVLVANGHLERGQHLSTYLPELNVGGDQTEWGYEHQIKPEDVAEAARLAGGVKRVLLYASGVGPNMGFSGGTWKASDYADIARRLVAEGIRPLLVGANTEDDKTQRDLVLKALGTERGTVDDIVGQTNIPQYISLIENCSAWVGLNSGGGIVAAMRGTPTVMLWSDAKYPIHNVDPSNRLHTRMKTSFVSEAQLVAGTYRTLSLGSPELTPAAVVKQTLEVMR